MYRVVTYREEFEQIAALPAEALPFYATVLDMVFGANGEGTATYLILEQTRSLTGP